MTAIELFVIAFGLFLGYWVVSKLLRGGSRPSGSTTDTAPDAVAASQADGAQHMLWHDVLDVSRDAAIEELRAAYEAKLLQYHPEKVATMGKELRELAQMRTTQIEAAYQEALRERGRA